MKQNLKILAELRRMHDKHKEILAEKKTEFEKENQIVIDLIEDIQGRMQASEDLIREEAMLKYKETGEKKLEFGVGIRVMKRLNYDEKEAFSWAKDHSLALALDKRAFEKIAKVDDIDFVETTEEAMATIPKEINLGEEE